jgi:hypothetical protein
MQKPLVVFSQAYSVSGCITLLGLTLLAQARRARAVKKEKAKQVVLATAIFDQEGRLLVSHEELLPTRKTTNDYNEQVSLMG